MWVDAAVLADDGFSPDRRIPLPDGRTPEEVAAAALTQAGLLVAADEGRLLLTSVHGISRYAASIATGLDGAFLVVRPGSLLSAELQAADRGPVPGAIPLRAWTASPGLPQLPWAGRREISRAGTVDRPWRLCEVEVGPDRTCRLSVVNSTSMWASGWGILLATAGLIAWFGARFPRLFATASFVIVVAAILVPDTFVPLTANGCLGWLLGILILIARRLVPSTTREVGATVPVHSRPRRLFRC